MKKFTKQYLYVKEYKGKLYLKYYDTVKKKYCCEVKDNIDTGLRFYYLDEKVEKNIHRSIDGYLCAEYTESNIKTYKNIKYQFRENDLPIFGEESIPVQYIAYNCDVNVENLDFKVPRVFEFDMEWKFKPGKKTNFKEPDNEITLITCINKNTNERFSMGFKEDVSDEFDHYIHCKNEKDIDKRFSNYVRDNADILIAHNGNRADFPMLANRGKMLNLSPHELSPFGIILDKQKADNFGYFDTVEIFGIECICSIEMLKKFQSPMPKYSLQYCAKTFLKESKVDYGEDGNLNDLYENNYRKFVEYGMQDTDILHRFIEKLALVFNVISLAYESCINFSEYNGTTSPHQNGIYVLVSQMDIEEWESHED